MVVDVATLGFFRTLSPKVQSTTHCLISDVRTSHVRRLRAVLIKNKGKTTKKQLANGIIQKELISVV